MEIEVFDCHNRGSIIIEINDNDLIGKNETERNEIIQHYIDFARNNFITKLAANWSKNENERQMRPMQ